MTDFVPAKLHCLKPDGTPYERAYGDGSASPDQDRVFISAEKRDEYRAGKWKPEAN